ncbi:MAG: translation elongation factor Ts [Candidatus Saccharibacteria bacterium]|nr:translation elongation factor Ts [Candidatus Saccharibacteria bacterium]
MSFTVEDVKKLKDLTGVGLTDARDALKEADGDFEKALEAMRKKGLTRAEKRGDRETRSGVIDSYIHDGRIGVLVEVNCETDFVARTEEFKALAHEIALQVAAMSPLYVSLEDVPAEEMERVKAEFIAADALKNKPADIADRIVTGQIDKYFAEKTLMKQDFIKDDSKKVEDLIKDAIAKLGENITIKRFKRIEVGLDD